MNWKEFLEDIMIMYPIIVGFIAGSFMNTFEEWYFELIVVAIFIFIAVISQRIIIQAIIKKKIGLEGWMKNE